MNLQLAFQASRKPIEIELPRSKSISNRLLIAQALSNYNFEIKDLSSAEDTRLLQKALSTAEQGEVNIGMAGTAMRFLTAYFSIQEGKKYILTGAERMKSRPIGVLVKQLRAMGAAIEYLEKDVYPPLNIIGKKLTGGSLQVDASVSSQFISAILLIAPYLTGGLELELTGKVVSFPYIDMTLSLMQQLGINSKRELTVITVEEGNYHSNFPIQVEPDWSAAAFFYQCVAFSRQSIFLKGLERTSIQGDSVLPEIFSHLGVKTNFKNDGVLLEPTEIKNSKYLEFDLLKTPDLAQPIAVTAAQLIEKTCISGISTLKIKETNRVEALKTELAKLGSRVEESKENTLTIYKSSESLTRDLFAIDTYNDHRMAMSFAPLAILYSTIQINNSEVVEKSFPDFWKELEKIGVSLKKV